MSDTADFFRARLHVMVDHQHPLEVLSKRLPWTAIEQALAPHFARKPRPGTKVSAPSLLGAHEFGNGISPAGRPRLPVRLMASLQYLKSAFNLSDEVKNASWVRRQRTGCRSQPQKSPFGGIRCRAVPAMGEKKGG
jgi:transposase, IS5 family